MAEKKKMSKTRSVSGKQENKKEKTEEVDEKIEKIVEVSEEEIDEIDKEAEGIKARMMKIEEFDKEDQDF